MQIAQLQRPTMPFTITAIVGVDSDQQHTIYITETNMGTLSVLVNEFNQVMGWKPYQAS